MSGAIQKAGVLNGEKQKEETCACVKAWFFWAQMSFAYDFACGLQLLQYFNNESH